MSPCSDDQPPFIQISKRVTGLNKPPGQGEYQFPRHRAEGVELGVATCRNLPTTTEHLSRPCILVSCRADDQDSAIVAGSRLVWGSLFSCNRRPLGVPWISRHLFFLFDDDAIWPPKHIGRGGEISQEIIDPRCWQKGADDRFYCHSKCVVHIKFEVHTKSH